jgi:hypothetical protein
MGLRTVAALACCAAGCALALDSAQWPPPAGVEARMRELQGVIISRDSSVEQRNAAREELGSLLKSPAGQSRPAPTQKTPPRAAIDPLPSIIKPADGRLATPPEIAHIEVVVPPRSVVVPQTGAVATPSGSIAVDGRTGAVLHASPSGYIDPRTGAFTPR